MTPQSHRTKSSTESPQAKALGRCIKPETDLSLGGDTSLASEGTLSSPLSFPSLNIFHFFTGKITPASMVWVLDSVSHVRNAVKSHVGNQRSSSQGSELLVPSEYPSPGLCAAQSGTTRLVC